MARKATSASEIIDTLGGTAATARLTHKSIQAVSNWRNTNRLPADTFLIIGAALEEKDISVSPSIFGIKEATQ